MEAEGLPRPRAGSLCTGYGGLELGLASAGVPVDLQFVADPDPAVSKLLALRYPGVPNLGDITNVDWATHTHTPIDILLAGYPCQGESLAGQRKGAADERWIWPNVADCIRHLRPPHVFLENVPGHRSMGFGRVLADLAALGYVGSWRSVRASDVGACHRRERLFIYAYPAYAESHGHRDAGTPWLRRLQAAPFASGAPSLLPTPAARLGISTSLTPEAAHRRSTTRVGKGPNLDDAIAMLPTPTAVDGNRATAHYPDQHPTLPDAVSLFPTPTAARYGSNQSPSPGAAVRPGLDSIGALLPTPRAAANENRSTGRTPSQEAGRHGLYLSSEVCMLPTPRASDGTKGGPNQQGSGGDLMLPSAVQPERWGRYAPAIARWEAILGRPAPEPTEPGISTAVRLSGAFPEWMMGLPAGWVSEVPGLSRNDVLRIVGNGVMRHQFAYAVGLLTRDRWGK